MAARDALRRRRINRPKSILTFGQPTSAQITSATIAIIALATIR